MSTATNGPDSVPPDAVPVLIVGGGPVGLSLAVELAQQGIDCLVVERREEVSWLRPRAKTTSARTMEHFRRWGLADEIRRRAALPVAWSDEVIFCTTLFGREITRIDRCFGLDLAGSELVAECGQQVPQPLVEEVLREAVSRSPSATLLTGHQVVSVARDDEGDGVDVEVTDGHGATRSVHATYVVGCEGARSIVRDAIGARYEGSDAGSPNFNVVFRAATLSDLMPHGPAVHYWILNPDQPGVVGRLDLDETWWCIAQGISAEEGEADPERLIRNLFGAPEPVPVEVVATDAWKAKMQLVDRYRDGPLFLAGDAAHLNPPWGGHGFNTGIGDAVNLGWKLAAVINGWAPATLLDSYAAERRPVAARTIADAVANMGVLSSELVDVRLNGSASDFALAQPEVAAAIHASKDLEFHSLSLTLGYDYASSPIVVGDGIDVTDEVGVPSVDGYRPTAAAGHRLPHHWMSPGISLYDRLASHLCLVGDPASPAWESLLAAARSMDVPLEPVVIEQAICRPLFGASVVLVRPDQHVAWRGNVVADADAVLRRAIGEIVVPS